MRTEDKGIPSVRVENLDKEDSTNVPRESKKSKVRWVTLILT